MLVCDVSSDFTFAEGSVLEDEVVHVLRLRLGGVHNDIGVAWPNDLNNSGLGDGMVEVDVFRVPRAGEIVLARLLKRVIHGWQVLRAAHRWDPSLGRGINRSVLQGETGGEPSLLNFWVDSVGAVEVGIYLCKDF